MPPAFGAEPHIECRPGHHASNQATENGGTYDYFFCIGRRTGCSQPYILAQDLEEAVVDYYATVQLEPERVEDIRSGILSEMDAERKRSNFEVRRQERRLLKLARQRDKLLKAHYAGAVPLEQLKREQERISRETADAERSLGNIRLAFADVEGTLTDALRLAVSCQAAYREAEPGIRRLMNQAFFEKLFVEGDRIQRAELKPEFAVLLAEDLARRIHKRSADRLSSGVGSNNGVLVVLIEQLSNSQFRQTLRILLDSILRSHRPPSQDSEGKSISLRKRDR